MKKILLGLLIFTMLFIGYFFIGGPPQPEKIDWGVNFSQKHAELLGLDWQENYSALLSDLGVERIKVLTQWDLLEPAPAQYDFNDLDWQIEEAEKQNAKVLLVMGIKTGRWPECHIPDWTKNLSKEEQQNRILKLIENIVLRYQNSKVIWAWQVENEPLFPFGECPWTDKVFLKKEIQLVKSLDSKPRPVIISDSGEGSFWITAAQLGDIIATTMYKKVWFNQLNTYVYYPLPPTFYWRKAQLIDKIFNKKVIVGELQAEPWGPKLLYESPIEEQEKSMNLEMFKSNIEFAKKTGLDEFYLWGAEWWYWMKTKQNKPEIWQEAQKLF